MEYTLSPSPTNTYFSPPFTHPSTHSRSVIFWVPCSPSLCMALHIPSLIRPLKVSAESGAAESSARAATHARVFRIHLPPELSGHSLQQKTRILEYSEGLRPSDSPTRSLARSPQSVRGLCNLLYANRDPRAANYDLYPSNSFGRMSVIEGNAAMSARPMRSATRYGRYVRLTSSMSSRPMPAAIVSPTPTGGRKNAIPMAAITTIP